jgi:putative DNA methylase
VLTGSAMPGNHLKTEGAAGRMGVRLLAVVAEGHRNRTYLGPTPEHEEIACLAVPDTESIDAQLSRHPQYMGCVPYGLDTIPKLFTRRQLMALLTFSDLVGEARQRLLADARSTTLSDDAAPLHEGGSGAVAYADAIATYLSLGVTKLADNASTICSWHSGAEHQKIRATFSRQALPMTWDFAEGNAFSGSTGNFYKQISILAEALSRAESSSYTQITNGASQNNSFPVHPAVISTDPPYYDNIPYADLSDFFYVWLKRSLSEIWPSLFRRLSTPKSDELVADIKRHGNLDHAHEFFMEGMGKALTAMCNAATADEPLVTGAKGRAVKLARGTV